MFVVQTAVFSRQTLTSVLIEAYDSVCIFSSLIVIPDAVLLYSLACIRSVWNFQDGIQRQMWSLSRMHAMGFYRNKVGSRPHIYIVLASVVFSSHLRENCTLALPHFLCNMGGVVRYRFTRIPVMCHNGARILRLWL